MIAALYAETLVVPFLLLLLLCVTGALGLSALSPRLLVLTTCMLFPLACLAYTPLLHVVLAVMVRREHPVQADAIVVLGGGVNCATSKFLPVTQRRFDRGFQLWQAGYAPVLVFSQQSRRTLGPDCPTDATVATRLIHLALPGQSVPIEVLPDVVDTFDEARATANLVRKHHWTRILLVTSNWHSRRAAQLFQRQGIVLTSTPTQEPVPSGFVPTIDERHTLLRELGAYFKALVLGQLVSLAR
ncbi:YdcF family protein (plasmid) [Deinococcus radiomollis]|uniref:YdcF family protein n=1 Tax=Deinococcus radiomollis TaxID=468916 RepID=UPI0038920F2F